MAIDPGAEDAILECATAGIAAFLDEAGRKGIDRAAEWLTPERMRQLRDILNLVEPLFPGRPGPAAPVTERWRQYRERLVELESLLREMQSNLQSLAGRISEQRELMDNVGRWLAAYRSLK